MVVKTKYYEKIYFITVGCPADTCMRMVTTNVEAAAYIFHPQDGGWDAKKPTLAAITPAPSGPRQNDVGTRRIFQKDIQSKRNDDSRAVQGSDRRRLRIDFRDSRWHPAQLHTLMQSIHGAFYLHFEHNGPWWRVQRRPG